MQNPQQLKFCRIDVCNDPNIEASVAWTEDDTTYLLIEMSGLNSDRNIASLEAWGLLGQSKMDPPVLNQEVYLYDDLLFYPSLEQTAFPISLNRSGGWYWATPGTVRSYEDGLTAEDLLRLDESLKVALHHF